MRHWLVVAFAGFVVFVLGSACGGSSTQTQQRTGYDMLLRSGYTNLSNVGNNDYDPLAPNDVQIDPVPHRFVLATCSDCHDFYGLMGRTDKPVIYLADTNRVIALTGMPVMDSEDPNVADVVVCVLQDPVDYRHLSPEQRQALLALPQTVIANGAYIDPQFGLVHVTTLQLGVS